MKIENIGGFAIFFLEYNMIFKLVKYSFRKIKKIN